MFLRVGSGDFEALTSLTEDHHLEDSRNSTRSCDVGVMSVELSIVNRFVVLIRRLVDIAWSIWVISDILEQVILLQVIPILPTGTYGSYVCIRCVIHSMEKLHGHFRLRGSVRSMEMSVFEPSSCWIEVHHTNGVKKLSDLFRRGRFRWDEPGRERRKKLVEQSSVAGLRLRGCCGFPSTPSVP